VKYFEKNKIPFFIFSLAFVLHLAAIIYIGNFYNPQMWEFGEIADNILQGKGHSYFTVEGKLLPSAYMPPAYSFILAGFFLLFGKTSLIFFIIQFLHCLFSVVTCVLIYFIAREIFNRTVAVFSTIAVSLYPPFLYINSQIHPIPIYMMLYCLVFFLLINLRRRPSVKLSIFSGIFSGVLVLFRPEFLLYSIILAIWIFFNVLGRIRIKLALVYLLITAAIILPWCTRNFLLFNRFTTNTALGTYLVRGWNENATGTGRDSWPSKKGTILPISIEEKIGEIEPTKDFEAKMDSLLFKEGVSYIRSNPRKAVVLALKKIYYFWWFDPTHYATRHPLYLGPWIAILPFFIIGIVFSLKQAARFSLFYIYFTMPMLQALFSIVLPRYRMTAEPFIIIFAVYALYCLRDKFSLKRLK